MAVIEVSIEINTPVDKVWAIISDLDNEPKFWKGTKEIRNISSDKNIVKREVTIAFRDQKCIQEVKLHPKEKIETTFTKGIIEGTKIINLGEHERNVRLDVIWNIKLSGLMGMFTGVIINHIKSGTELALQKIKEESER